MPDDGAACGADCGWCGRCTTRYDRREDDEANEPILYCAAPSCGLPIERVSIAVLTTKYHSVVVCSDICRMNLEASLDE